MRSSGGSDVADRRLGRGLHGLQARVVVEDAVALRAVQDEERGPLLKEAGAFAIAEAGELGCTCMPAAGTPARQRRGELQTPLAIAATTPTLRVTRRT